MGQKCNQNSRLGLIFEDIINHHGLHIIANTGFTYHQSTIVSDSGKSTIDLTLTCGLKNIKLEKNEFDLQFKNEIEEKINSVLELNQTSSSEIFNKKHIKLAIKNSNKNSAPGPDRITVELIENGSEQLFHCLSHIMQASYFLGYSLKTWKKENQMYLKKTDKESYHLETLTA